MAIADRRERERQEIRRKILDAARELFAREGFEQVTMRRIAEAIEYSPTTIYLHFKDKDELVRSLCETDFARLLAAFEAAKPPKDPVEAIRRIGLAYARFGLENPNHYRFMFMTPMTPKPAPQDPDDMGDGAYGYLLQAVKRAMAEGSLRRDDAEAVSQVLWASVHGAVALLVTFGRDGNPRHPWAKDFIERVVNTAIRGLVVTPRKARRR